MARSKPTPEPLAVDLETAAVMLGVGRTLAFELARSGELPTVFVGARRRVPIKSIEQMLETSKAEPLAG